MLQRVSSGSLRCILREETAGLHHMLEAQVAAFGAFDTATGYARWLEIMQNLHACYAQAYDAGASALGLAPLAGALSDALAQDTDAPTPDVPPACATDAEALGIAYVFEGSGVGARLLQRKLAHLGPLPGRYLQRLSDESYTRWPHMKRALAEIPCTGYPEDNPAVKGARTVFEMFSDAFTRTEK